MRDNSKLARILVGFVFSAVLVGIAPAARSSLPPLPPAAPVRPIVDDYFGTKIVDPYRYMEDLNDPRVQAWLKAQNDYTRALLALIPGRAKLLARIKTLNESAPSEVFDLRRLPGGRVFCQKRLGSGEVAKLYMRARLGGEETLLVDPLKYDKPGGPHNSLLFYMVSQDAHLVAYGITAGGSRNLVVHVVDINTLKETSESIDRVIFPLGFVPSGWRPDNRSFFYTRLRKPAPNSPASEIYQQSRVYLHIIGTDPDRDQPVFGGDLSSGAKMAPADLPSIVVPPGLHYAIGLIVHGGQREVTMYAAPLHSIGKPGTPWRKICDVEDAVAAGAVHGNDLFLLTHKNASHFKVVQTRFSNPDLATARDVIPQSDRVITNLAAGSDALYVDELDGGIARLVRVPFNNLVPETIRLPFKGSLNLVGYDPRVPGTMLSMGTWTKADQLYAYDPAERTIRNTGIQPLGPYDARSDIESVEVKVRSKDGTLVPLSIVHKKGISLDGSNPTILEGYGAYANVEWPTFYRWSLAWLERGGILATAHVRGGGEYGDEWHRAGMMQSKLNTVQDFLACAHYLIDMNYTSTPKLAGSGISAGGITIGRAITLEPQIFGAALDRAGLSDTLRKEVTANGALTVQEYGSTKTKEGFDALLAMSPYNHVVNGTPYPAVMLTTGINDPNVDPWQAGKMTARLQAASTSGKPILLRINYQGGHIAVTKTDVEEVIADEESFLLWQFGDPEFQPSESQARSSAG